MHELNKSQLEKVTGGAVASDPNTTEQEELLEQLEKRLAEYMKSNQGQRLVLPDRIPSGSILGGGIGSGFGGFGNGPFPDPLALQ